jgi:hypothetical protein
MLRYLGKRYIVKMYFEEKLNQVPDYATCVHIYFRGAPLFETSGSATDDNTVEHTILV